MAILRIKSSHVSQGDFVIIEEDDFNKDIHQLYIENEVIKVIKEKPVKDIKVNTLADK
jgi:hypothetical protein